MNSFFHQTIEQTIEMLQTDREQGLSSQSAAERLQQYGENRLQEKKPRSTLQMVLDQLKNFLVMILIGASIVSIAVGEWTDGIVILIIVILNAILGVVQENRASNALKALKEMAAPQAKVIRGGSIIKLSSSQLVPGDIVLLEAGDYVPADLRLVQSVNLKIEEAALTGESVPVDKDAEGIISDKAPIAEWINSAFMSTVVTYGRGKGIVAATGMGTQIGKVALMLENVEEEKTPLQKKLEELGKFLGIACLIVCVIIFGLGWIRGQNILEIFMTAVSLAVAAIPEGLPAVVTVVLAVGMQKMIHQHAIMKQLGAVETLGSTTVICSDKTGTLTQNKMTVVKVFDGEDIWAVSGRGYGIEGELKREDDSKKQTSKALELLLQAGVLCNDAELKQEKEEIIGDPTEGALVVLGTKGGYPKEALSKKFPRIDEIPFDSKRKLMSTFHQQKNKIIMYTKGAPDNIIDRSNYILQENEVISFTQTDKNKMMEINRQFADEALRVLGFAYKEIKEKKEGEQREKELIFLGLVGMIDPPREEAKKAIEKCKNAGIKVVMITGDHKTTAGAIGREIGLLDEKEQTVEGKDLEELSDIQLIEKVKNVRVYARVSPEHKVRIVKALRSNGEIAAMTGDGVNDAPALKQADIGIAMGITGTDVAKEAANMILTDDNFASIVAAVEQGRTIYSNIRKFVGFLLSCNIGELLLIFAAMIIGTQIPLLPIQLLWINLITDAFPAFALGMEPKEEKIMEQPPRDPKEPIIDRKMKIAVSAQSISLALAALFSFLYGLNTFTGDTLTMARTGCFITLVVGELIRAYSARSETKAVYRINLFSNQFLNGSVFLSLALLFIVVYVPVLQPIFHTTALSFRQLGIVLLFSLIPMIGGEVAKKISAKNR